MNPALANGANALKVGLCEEPWHVKAVSCSTVEAIFALGFLDGSRIHLEGQLGPSASPPVFSSHWSCFPAHTCLAMHHFFHEPAHHCDDLMLRCLLSCFPATANASLHPVATVAVSCSPDHANLPLTSLSPLAAPTHSLRCSHSHLLCLSFIVPAAVVPQPWEPAGAPGLHPWPGQPVFHRRGEHAACCCLEIVPRPPRAQTHRDSQCTRSICQANTDRVPRFL